MKNLKLAGMSVLMLAGAACAEILAGWDFNGQTAAGSFPLNSAISAEHMNASQMTLNGSKATGVVNTGRAGIRLESGYHSFSEAVAADRFIEFTLTSQPGYAFAVTDVSFELRSGGSGRTNSMALSSSALGYSNMIGRVIRPAAATQTSGFAAVVPMGGEIYTNLTALTVRVYMWGENPAGSYEGANLAFGDSRGGEPGDPSFEVRGTVYPAPVPAGGTK